MDCCVFRESLQGRKTWVRRIEGRVAAAGDFADVWRVRLFPAGEQRLGELRVVVALRHAHGTDDDMRIAPVKPEGAAVRLEMVAGRSGHGGNGVSETIAM